MSHFKIGRREHLKVNAGKIETVSCPSKDMDRVNLLLPSTYNKMKRLRRRTTGEHDIVYTQDGYFKVINNRNENIQSNQCIIATQSDENNDKSEEVVSNSPELNWYLSRRRRSNTSPDVCNLAVTQPIPMDIAQTDLYPTEKFQKLDLISDRKSKSLKKMRELVQNVLRNNLEHCTYKADLSKQRCTHLSQILETTLRTSLNTDTTEYKVVAIVYIGEIREYGIKQSCQYSWNPDTDLFVMETYRHEDMLATGIVFATMVESREEYDIEEYEV